MSSVLFDDRVFSLDTDFSVEGPHVVVDTELISRNFQV